MVGSIEIVVFSWRGDACTDWPMHARRKKKIFVVKHLALSADAQSASINQCRVIFTSCTWHPLSMHTLRSLWWKVSMNRHHVAIDLTTDGWTTLIQSGRSMAPGRGLMAPGAGWSKGTWSRSWCRFRVHRRRKSLIRTRRCQRWTLACPPWLGRLQSLHCRSLDLRLQYRFEVTFNYGAKLIRYYWGTYTHLIRHHKRKQTYPLKYLDWKLLENSRFCW